MTTTEKLLVQIFERKKRIIEQVSNQIQLFDRHLTSICLLDGIPPPPSLFSPYFLSFSSHPNELKKEELISGLLLPPSRLPDPYSSSHYSLHQNHIVSAECKDLPSTSCTEVYASNYGTSAGDRSPVCPKFNYDDNTRFTINSVAELDPCVRSPPDRGNARMLDDWRVGVPPLDPGVTSPPHCGDERIPDDCGDHGFSLVKIQRSKCRQKALQLRNSAKASKLNWHDENAVGYGSQGIGCGISSIQFDHVDELVLVKAIDTNNRGFDQEVKIGECRGKEKDVDIHDGRILAPGSSIQLSRFANESVNDGDSSCLTKEDAIMCEKDFLEQTNNFNEMTEFVDPSLPAEGNCMEENVDVVDCRDNEPNNISHTVIRAASSVPQVSAPKEALGVGKSFSFAEELEESLDKLSDKKPSRASELMTLTKSSSVIANENYTSRKAKTSDKKIIEKDGNTHAGKVTISRSSSQQPNCLNKFLNCDNSCGNGKELNQLCNHIHEVIESVKPLDISCQSSGVKEKVGGCQNINARSDAYCHRITGSSSIKKLDNEFSKVDESSDIVKDGHGILVCSSGKSLQAPPKASGFAQDAGFIHQALSGTQMNVLPFTQNILPEIDTDGARVVEVHSVSFKCKSFGTGCGVEVLESEPLSECAVHVNVKKLDSDDVEDNSLLKAQDPALETIKDDTEKWLSTSLHSTNVLLKTTSVGYHEKPNLSMEMPHSEVQDFSREFRRDAPEGQTEGGIVLVDGSTINSVQEKTNSFVSLNQKVGSFLMGSLPQNEQMEMEGQTTNALSTSPVLTIKLCQPMHSYHKGVIMQSDVVKSPIDDMPHPRVEHKKIEESEASSSKQQVDMVDICLEGIHRKASTASSIMLEQQIATSVINSKRLAGFSLDLSEEAEVADPDGSGMEAIRHDNAEENQIRAENTAVENHVLCRLEDELELENAVASNYAAMQETQHQFARKGNLPCCSSGSPLRQSVIGNDCSMPEFKGFVTGTDNEQPCTANGGVDLNNLDFLHAELGCANVLERLKTSSSPSTLNLYQSIPSGLLEDVELRSSLNINGDGRKQIGASYSFLVGGNDNTLHGQSHSISLPLSDSQSALDVTKPCTSPVGKFWDGIPLNSGSSDRRVSSISELPSIREENEIVEGVPDRILEGAGAILAVSPVKREALADITKNSNPFSSVYEAEIHDDRISLASISTQVSFSFSATCDWAKTKLEHMNSNTRKLTSKDKKNHNISLGGDNIKRGNGSLHSRFSRPKLSGKASLRKGEPSLLEKQSKLNNIVSNITSFIPLVQQKQAPAVITGKRDIKVKALEAAEAAKRNALKKENERKMKKEALKLERAKIEEQNLRQLELDKKKKEEERKKKEADMAAKKRQREEERKEKERKRMHVEEAKRHQVAHDKKLHAEKELREDAKAHERKESKAKFEKHEKIDITKEGSNFPAVSQTKPMTTKLSETDNINSSVIPEDHRTLSNSGDNLKVTGSTGKASESDSLVSNITHEQSYEISPYKGSDDEDEDLQNNKFIPSWASKSLLSIAVASQQRIDPESVFPPQSFCSIAEVLLPRSLQQN